MLFDVLLGDRGMNSGFAMLRSGTALVTTFRRNSDRVATPVSVAVAGDRAWFVTAADSGKAKRLARNPR